ncbi:MAG TPA: hypothetical protein VGL94_06950 [Ktedonobacteraceae bacterium]
MNVRPFSPDNNNSELQRVIARIRSRGAHQALPTPTPAALAAIVAHLRDEEPLTAKELDEREREWAALEAEQGAVEQADGYRGVE